MKKDEKRDICSGEKPAKHHRHLHLLVHSKSHVGVPDEVLGEVLGPGVFEPCHHKLDKLASVPLGLNKEVQLDSAEW